MKTRKRLSAFMAILILLMPVLTACAEVQPPATTAPPQSAAPETTAAPVETEPETITLRVLTDEAPSPGHLMILNKVIAKVAREFEKANENVEIALEYLPGEKDARAAAIAQIHEDIDDGIGPDIFLLSTTQAASVQSRLMDTTWEPLFPLFGYEVAVRTFADLAPYYDADTDLNKDALINSVMDSAGLVMNGRYMIPLRYNFPVAYVDMDQFAETGLSTDIFEIGGVDLIRALAEKEVSVSVDAGCNVLCELLADPDLKEDELLADIQAYQKLLPHIYEGTHETRTSVFMLWEDGEDAEGDFYWGNDSTCMQFSTLETAIDQTVIAQAVGMNLGMFPISNLDGAMVADVTFYGAVNADCTHPDLAYEFISGFLTEDAQWEKNVTANAVPLTTLLMADGYPVLTVGSVEALFANMNYHQKDSQWQSVINSLEITDEDVPILSEHPPALGPDWEEIQLGMIIATITEETTEDEIRELIRPWVKAN